MEHKETRPAGNGSKAIQEGRIPGRGTFFSAQHVVVQRAVHTVQYSNVLYSYFIEVSVRVIELWTGREN